MPVVPQPPDLLFQAGGWVKGCGIGPSLLVLGVVAATAGVEGHDVSSGWRVTTNSASKQ